MRFKKSLVPMICTVISAGVAALILTETWGLYDAHPFYLCIGVMLIPFIYALITLMTFSGVLGKDGAVVLSIIIIPIFVVAVLFIMGFVIPIGIDGIG